jgi:catechol 2,3-dioxygenase-like lactoylglutathione lyase family enzyme
MEFHQGRLIDHVHLRVRDLAASRAFYQAVLGALGRRFTHEGENFFSSDELYVDAAEGYESRVHLAFQAADRDAVARFYEAGLAHGGRDNGAPGERNYHPGYYACFLLDPDGNNIEAVCHGPTKRSADEILVEG